MRAALQRNDAKAASALAWQVVKDRPEDADARLLLASAHQLNGHHDDAITEANVAIQLQPQAPGAYLTKAAAFASLKRSFSKSRRPNERSIIIPETDSVSCR